MDGCSWFQTTTIYVTIANNAALGSTTIKLK